MNQWHIGLGILLSSMLTFAKDIQLLNVSYDPTREFYQQYNQAFTNYYHQLTGDNVVIRQSHGGSGKQATAVINGIRADVVTLALQSDVDAIASRGRINPHWQQHFPNHSAPYTSTIVFLVRRNNPKHIHDWNDLIKPGVAIVTPNAKTSGGARWNYLAAWGYGLDSHHGDEAQAGAFVKALYKNVVVQDSGARGATNTFVERGIGDVLIAWESEAWLALNRLHKDQFEVITPSESIVAEPVVSVVDKVVDLRGSRKVATEYLNYLYSAPAQKIAAENYYRPRDPTVLAQYASLFRPLKLFTVEQKFGGWTQAQKRHFSAGGSYDQIMDPRFN